MKKMNKKIKLTNLSNYEYENQKIDKVKEVREVYVNSDGTTSENWNDAGDKFDNIKKPFHYCKNGIEVINVIEAFDLNYRTGNAVKYILRSKFKNNKIEDLKKAKQYISREIKKLEGQKGW